jgi:NADH-quinone oxidoreductase subunit J
MEAIFSISSVIAIAATVMVITRTNAVHAVLYLIVSLLAVALVFYTLGAPFAAALEVITYAGAIMVLFIFVAIMLNLGKDAEPQERRWLQGSLWVGPAILAAILLIELIWVFAHKWVGFAPKPVFPKRVGVTLFGPYLLAVELSGMLLLAALVGAYHLARREALEQRQ